MRYKGIVLICAVSLTTGHSAPLPFPKATSDPMFLSGQYEVVRGVSSPEYWGFREGYPNILEARGKRGEWRFDHYKHSGKMTLTLEWDELGWRYHAIYYLTYDKDTKVWTGKSGDSHMTLKRMW